MALLFMVAAVTSGVTLFGSRDGGGSGCDGGIGGLDGCDGGNGDGSRCNCMAGAWLVTTTILGGFERE
jgi:hypothetical protein